MNNTLNNQVADLKNVTFLRRLVFALATAVVLSAPSFVSAQTGSSGLFLRNASYVQQTGTNNPLSAFDVGWRSKPAFVDINADGDFDLFVGESDGTINYYENTGNATNPVFAVRTGGNNPLWDVEVAGGESAPTFGDLDGDGDMDAFIGAADYRLHYYENIGDATNAIFILRTGAADPLSPFAGPTYFNSKTSPTLTDVNGDGKIDVVVGNITGGINYFRNTGSVTNPVFAAGLGASNPFDGIDVGADCAPFAVDRNGNGRPEGFILGAQNARNYPCPRPTGDGAYAIPAGVANYPIFNLGEGRSAPTMVDLDGNSSYEIVQGGESGKLTYFKPIVTVFAGWQSQNFNLPGEAALAAAAFDADGDRIVNLVEYAFGLLPKSPDTNSFSSALLDNNGHLSQAIQMREDDPSLTVAAEVSNDLTFTSVTTVLPVVTDPDPDDSVKTLTFTDPVTASGAPQRFMRFQFSVGP